MRKRGPQYLGGALSICREADSFEGSFLRRIFRNTGHCPILEGQDPRLLSLLDLHTARPAPPAPAKRHDDEIACRYQLPRAVPLLVQDIFEGRESSRTPS